MTVVVGNTMFDEDTTCIGIDLGTTYSCLAFIDETGTPVVAKNRNGDTNTPSVVHFPERKPHCECEVGQIAKESAIVDPERTVQLFKPHMGKPKAVVKTIDGEDITPTEASSHVLRKIACDYKERYGFDIETVVITVPAHFGYAEREATKRAGEGAGLNVVGLVQEPVAAATFYGVMESNEDACVLVYDLGGGTFDVTVINVSNSGEQPQIDVICAEGDHDLGGRLWDDRVIEYLKDEYTQATNFDGEYSAFANQQLRTAAEDAKKRLTETDSTRVTLNLDNGLAAVSLTRELFDDMTSDLLKSTIALTRKAIEKSEDAGFPVEKILLVGGSTWMPQVRSTLEETFPAVSIERTDPAEAVAKGACLYADSYADRLKYDGGGKGGSKGGLGPSDEPFVYTLVAPKSYGVEVLYDDGTERINNLILKNQRTESQGESGESCRFEVDERYGTVQDDQKSVALKIYESDIEKEYIPLEDGKKIVEDKLDIAEFHLPKDSPIDVSFMLDESGLLHIHGVEPNSGRFIDFQTTVEGLQSVDEISDKVIGNDGIALCKARQ